MEHIYNKPLRVYLILGFFSVLGILCFFSLPISLFPRQYKPEICIYIPLENTTPQIFFQNFGEKLDKELRDLNTSTLEAETLKSYYKPESYFAKLTFKWGSNPRDALMTVSSLVSARTSKLPFEIQQNLSVWINNENSGFLSLSFFSEERTLEETKKILKERLESKLNQIPDADDPEFWDPLEKEIKIEIDPDEGALLGIYPNDIENAINQALEAQSIGSIALNKETLEIKIPHLITSPLDFNQILIPRKNAPPIHLDEIGNVSLTAKTLDSRAFFTNGAKSIILYSTPKPGKNIKKMASDILSLLKKEEKKLPPDIHYRVLVDPSEVITHAIQTVGKEVALAALLAVIVLILFIGNFSSVMTAAIEIPMSMVLSFILMKVFNLNINLISLAGLALSSGMNVDASVVVLDNILRHISQLPFHTLRKEKLRAITKAVSEVRAPIIVSTLTSLIVFFPLIFSTGLSKSLLGDLALSITFSHGFSALVSLFLVPTIRMHIFSHRPYQQGRPLLEPFLHKGELFYASILKNFAFHRFPLYGLFILAIFFLISCFILIKKLPKDLIGQPNSSWIQISARSENNTIIPEMQYSMEKVETAVRSSFGSWITDTFCSINHPNFANLLVHLKDKSTMKQLLSEFENTFLDTPKIKFTISPWNPSEIQIIDPPDMRVVVRGEDYMSNIKMARSFIEHLRKEHIFSKIYSDPELEWNMELALIPNKLQWSLIEEKDPNISLSDVNDLIKIGTLGKKINEFSYQNQMYPIVLRFPKNRIQTFSDLKSLPLGIDGRVLSLKAVMDFVYQPHTPSLYKENGKDMIVIYGKENKIEKNKFQQDIVRAKDIALSLQETIEEPLPTSSPKSQGAPAHKKHSTIDLEFEDPAQEITQAITQISISLFISLLLIILLLIIQLNSFIDTFIILISIPSGIIGVVFSLYLFHGTLSLNSILGIILLNGIAVGNAIIILDFIKKLIKENISLKEAVIKASVVRLRPILITSLTSILGMFPIAIGFGEGGEILKPLGLAICGGLWVSVPLTLYFVPSLYYLAHANEK